MPSLARWLGLYCCCDVEQEEGAGCSSGGELCSVQRNCGGWELVRILVCRASRAGCSSALGWISRHESAHVCVRLNREAMFCINWVPKHKASGQYPRPKVSARDVKVREGEEVREVRS